MSARKWMLTQNSELRAIGAYNWTLPAFVVQLSDGSFFNACPAAGACAKVCYAKQGMYLFPAVKAAHVRNLEMVLNDLDGWKSAMTAEVSHKRYQGKHVRIHDAGDFFSDEYLAAWLDIIRVTPGVIFYAYTKEVDRFRRLVENGSKPPNFLYLFSYGGKQDRLVDDHTDRVADIFPSFESMEAAGYSTQHESDLQAIYNDNNRVGIPYNNIPPLKKKLAGRTFKEWQSTIDANRDAKAASSDEPRLPNVEHLCICGNPFAGRPAEGCARWGHAVRLSVEDTVAAEETGLTDHVSVADPDNFMGSPAYDGKASDAHRYVMPGRYQATAEESGTEVILVVAIGASWIEAA